jgi:hypothetical protein
VAVSQPNVTRAQRQQAWLTYKEKLRAYLKRAIAKDEDWVNSHMEATQAHDAVLMLEWLSMANQMGVTVDAGYDKDE